MRFYLKIITIPSSVKNAVHLKSVQDIFIFHFVMTLVLNQTVDLSPKMAPFERHRGHYMAICLIIS